MEGKEKLTLASFLLSIKKLSHLELIWAVVQQKSTQHCKAIILQFKKRKKKKEREKLSHNHFWILQLSSSKKRVSSASMANAN